MQTVFPTQSGWLCWWDGGQLSGCTLYFQVHDALSLVDYHTIKGAGLRMTMCMRARVCVCVCVYEHKCLAAGC